MKVCISRNTSEGEYIKIIVSMGSVVLLYLYSDFPADHSDFNVYIRVREKAEAQKSTLNTVNGSLRHMK